MTGTASSPVGVLELYCGIGGCAAALAGLPGPDTVVAALDIDRRALDVYRRNFPHPVEARTLDSISARELAGYGADLWWLSPPCQPFTRRGLRRDDRDPRSRSLLALLDRLDRLAELGPEAPRHLALENVPGFAGSRCHGRLLEILERGGYRFVEGCLCPTEMGVPNRRRRYYLAASRDGAVADFRPAGGDAPEPEPLAGFLDPAGEAAACAELRVDPGLVSRYQGALDVVNADAPRQVTACFTAAYGRSPVRSGSYLRLPDGGLRRFSPREVLRLLGFPESYVLPPDLQAGKAWPLAGNSLSVPVVRRVLASLPPFHGAPTPGWRA